MIATLMDLRRNPKKVLQVIERNESVILTNRGRAAARIEPLRKPQRTSMMAQQAFGIWAIQEDKADPAT